MFRTKRTWRSRTTVILGTWTVYALAFVPLYHAMGQMVAALGVFPVAVTGWLLGMWGGVLGSVAVFVLHVLLVGLAGGAGWEAMSRGGGLFGSVLIALIGAMVGRMRDLGERVREELGRRRQAEEKLRLYAARLERSNRDLEDFAYVASHDLCEPLRKVQAFGERLQSRYGDVLNERGIDYLQRMQEAARRMQVLIDSLLTLSRVQTKALPFVPVDLAAAARETVSDLEVRIRETGARVLVGELPTLDADPTQMRELLQNLIGNALKFHRAEEPPVVQVHGQLLDDEGGDTLLGRRCRVVVQDNGIGFDERYLDRIFQPFQRLHGRDEYEGVGMGLAICRKIVERHGGAITARSTPGQGAAFVVTLPVRQPNGVDEP